MLGVAEAGEPEQQPEVPAGEVQQRARGAPEVEVPAQEQVVAEEAEEQGLQQEQELEA